MSTSAISTQAGSGCRRPASLPNTEYLREDRDDHADWVVEDEDVDARIDGTRSEGPKAHKLYVVEGVKYWCEDRDDNQGSKEVFSVKI